jgi:hypothetical protein
MRGVPSGDLEGPRRKKLIDMCLVRRHESPPVSACARRASASSRSDRVYRLYGWTRYPLGAPPKRVAEGAGGGGRVSFVRCTLRCLVRGLGVVLREGQLRRLLRAVDHPSVFQSRSLLLHRRQAAPAARWTRQDAAAAPASAAPLPRCTRTKPECRGVKKVGGRPKPCCLTLDG